VSARRLPRELGVVIRCDHQDATGRCTNTLQTAAIMIGHIRTWSTKTQGWLRGKYPRGLFDYGADDNKKGDLVMRDVCPEHAPIAKAALEAKLAAREARRKARDEKRAAKGLIAQRDVKPENVQAAP